jgi:hypothetical protein
MNAIRQWLQRNASDLSYSYSTADEVRFPDVHSSRCQVTINRRQSYQIRVVSALHECGHVLIHKRRRKHKKKRISGCSFYEATGIRSL